MSVKKDKQTIQAIVAEELQRLLTQEETVIQLIHQIIHQHLSQLGSSFTDLEGTESLPQKTLPAPSDSLPTASLIEPSSDHGESSRLLCLLELEKWFRARPYLFSGFLRRPLVIPPEEMQAILQRAAEEKWLSSSEITALGAASLLIKGESADGDEEQVLVIQLSLNAEVTDIERAFELTNDLRKMGIKAAPLVAAISFSPQARQLAKEIRVALLEDVFPFSS